MKAITNKDGETSQELGEKRQVRWKKHAEGVLNSEKTKPGEGRGAGHEHRMTNSRGNQNGKVTGIDQITTELFKIDTESTCASLTLFQPISSSTSQWMQPCSFILST